MLGIIWLNYRKKYLCLKELLVPEMTFKKETYFE